eukprot:TRINITY_DN4319_c0_g2_i1.p1 TRINITY_DN4319_c0_g2~~TRINITY_DN4319_c0_g2_i1.p1  ORF type:complete len:281 (+),score=40.98 TRINITY_DN4319_c0_g2_i1:89-931(+)
MSSLAAARADNFYYPPDWDPKKGSINKQQGQHPLRERAKRLDEGILVVRFEMPFHVWCQKCGDMIAKGVRFNAEKKQIGSYFSTKIWSFKMTHHCGSVIDIHTDPKNTRYIVKEGAREKVIDWDNTDQQVLDLGSDEHRRRMREDPLYRLEVREESKNKSKTNQKRLEQLQEIQDIKHDDAFSSNSLLRKDMRKRRNQEKKLDSKRHKLGLHETVKLLPSSRKDSLRARTASTKQRRTQQSRTEIRKSLLGQSIFGGKEGGEQAELFEKKLRMNVGLRQR